MLQTYASRHSAHKGTRHITNRGFPRSGTNSAIAVLTPANPVQSSCHGWKMSPRQKLPTSISAPSHSYKDLGQDIGGIRRHMPRILVVDDNEDIMLLMQELLATRGYDVVGVPDAVHAEIEVLRHPPDLILSDV